MKIIVWSGGESRNHVLEGETPLHETGVNTFSQEDSELGLAVEL